ncbi:MAG: T9SS C-terminal target domain-containing protein [Candidatus Zixiibacteriota bacterium]|nr:MAG: T9SS C-terminal target domain-containing protein [candidate division Zixibacteria bacterium]
MEPIMRWLLILLIPSLLVPAGAHAQDYQFTREWDSVQVEIDGYTLPAAWTGGYSRSVPDACDIDGDGDLELFLGTWNGQFPYYQNIGTSHDPAFHLQAQTFQNIETFDQATFPEFWDMDADGDYDLFLYCFGLRVYENTGNSTAPNFVWVDSALHDIQGNPIYGFDPTLCDTDADGDQDLFIGTFTSGQLKYYQNVGDSSQYAYSLASSSYFGISTGQWCTPEFCDIDADGDYDLFIGDYYGRLRHWRNDGTSQQASFSWVTNQWQGIDVGDCAAPEFADLDSDGDFDLWVGREAYQTGSDNDLGDVFYYQNLGSPPAPQMQLVRVNSLTFDEGAYSKPILVDDDGDQRLDLWVSNGQELRVYRNTGTIAAPAFSLAYPDMLPGVAAHAVDLYDLDADGDKDLVRANGQLFNGEITFYRNVGTPQNPSFISMFMIQTPYDALGTVTLADMDGDGDGDMLLGAWGQGLVYYQNQGTPQQPSFVLLSENWQGISGGRNPRFCDFDLDGDVDLLTGVNTWGHVELWDNVGTPQSPQMVRTDSNLCDLVIGSPKPTGGDVDADGDVDLWVGCSEGGIYFFRNTTDTVSVSPYTRPHLQRVMDLSLSPQPGNPTTAISFQLPYSQEVDLAVYNLLGARVATLASGRMNAGSYSLPWESSGYASGIYFVRLATETGTLTRKLVTIQ